MFVNESHLSNCPVTVIPVACTFLPIYKYVDSVPKKWYHVKVSTFLHYQFFRLMQIICIFQAKNVNYLHQLKQNWDFSGHIHKFEDISIDKVDQPLFHTINNHLQFNKKQIGK